MITNILLGLAIAIGIANVIMTILVAKKKPQENISDIVTEQNAEMTTKVIEETFRQNQEVLRQQSNLVSQLSVQLGETLKYQGDFQKERLDSFERNLVGSMNSVQESLRQLTEQNRIILEKTRLTIDESLRRVSTESRENQDKTREVLEFNLKTLMAKNTHDLEANRKEVETSLRFITEANTKSLEKTRMTIDEGLGKVLVESRDSQEKTRLVIETNLKNLMTKNAHDLEANRKEVETSLRFIMDENTKSLDKTRFVVDQNLKTMSDKNAHALEEMRNVVDEKLSKTLETRLNQSFEVINKSLSQVNQGLGDMQNLAKDVGGLKNVLQNVKVRGTWAEWQLDNLLSEFLTKEQYVKNASVNPRSQERVDFVIKLPGNGEELLLPIDSKFPIEEYNRLVTASQNGDMIIYEKAVKNLEIRIKEEAKSISTKYICVPRTTDFAIMYLPIEGLYSEVVRKEGLCELLQRQYRITICGPSTLGAILTSLQMGFKTLAIEKKSSEIHKTLLVFKTHFTKFTELLEKTQKKITEASNTIDDATKRTRTIANKLNKVEIGTFTEKEIELEASRYDES